jgi:hypothetical protein
MNKIGRAFIRKKPGKDLRQLTASSRGFAAALPMAIIGSFGSFSSIRNTDVNTACRVPESRSTRSDVPAALRHCLSWLHRP